MLQNLVEGIKIEALAAAVPTTYRKVADVIEDERAAKRFSRISGVEGAYLIKEGQTASDLCYAAAKAIIEQKGIDPKKIGILIFVTQYPDYAIPATACVLQHRLGLTDSSIAFDINLGCSGFTHGLMVAMSLLQATNTDYALMLAGDVASSNYRRKGRTDNEALLFGDGGSAVLLAKDTAAPPIAALSVVLGQGYKAIIIPYGQARHRIIPENATRRSMMDEVAVMDFSTNKVPEMLEELMKLQGTTPQDYQHLVLHQANLLIMQTIAKRAGFSQEQLLVGIKKFANTSSASIPLALVDAFGEQEGEVMRLMLSGYGVGLTYSAVDIELATTSILPLVETDEYFVDGF